MWIKLSTITCNDHPRQLQCVPGGVVQPVKVGQNCALARLCDAAGDAKI